MITNKNGPTWGHESVMLSEVCEVLGDLTSGLIVDGTVGPGGHAEALLRKTGPDVRLLALDRDPEALKVAQKRLASFGNRVQFFHTGYEQLSQVLEEKGGIPADRILLDLGMSSLQLSSGRGFSVNEDCALDMRYDPTSTDLTAAEFLYRADQTILARAFAEVGQVPRPARLAREIKRESRAGRMRTMTDFRNVCHKVLGPRVRNMDSAILPCMVLRILVNRELERLVHFLDSISSVLAEGGKVAVLSYHSGEDRLVKMKFRELERKGGWRVLFKKGLRATPEEIRRNPRARSARLRVLERLESDFWGFKEL